MREGRISISGKKLSLLLLFGFVCFRFCSAQTQGFFLDKKKKKAVVPFELHSNLIVIPIIVNQKHPMNFILDTGIRPTVIFNKQSSDLSELVSDRKIVLKGIGNTGEVEAAVAGPVHMSMPGIKSSGMQVLVPDRDFLELDKHLGTHVHGIIGYDIFSRFVVKIDYAKKKIELREAQNFSAKKRYAPVDLEIKEGKPVAALGLMLNGKDSMTLSLLIDSGSSNALVLNSGSDVRIAVPSRNIETVIGRGLTGEIQGRMGRIDKIFPGETVLSDVIASFPDESVYSADRTYDRNGSVGGELLRRFTVIFDFYRSKMYLKPNAYRKVPFEYNMSGLEFSAEGQLLDVFVIKNVRAGSPADESGLQQGDVLIRLNNISADRLTLHKIYAELNRKSGKKISMIIFRDDTLIEKTFRLKREI